MFHFTFPVAVTFPRFATNIPTCLPYVLLANPVLWTFIVQQSELSSTDITLMYTNNQSLSYIFDTVDITISRLVITAWWYGNVYWDTSSNGDLGSAELSLTSGHTLPPTSQIILPQVSQLLTRLHYVPAVLHLNTIHCMRMQLPGQIVTSLLKRVCSPLLRTIAGRAWETCCAWSAHHHVG